MASSRTGRTSSVPVPSKTRGPRSLAPPRDPASSVGSHVAPSGGSSGGSTIAPPRAMPPYAQPSLSFDAASPPTQPSLRPPPPQPSLRPASGPASLRPPPMPRGEAGVATFPGFAIGAATSPVRGTKGATIHARGTGRLDLVLDFVAFVTKPMPLSLLLDEAPRRVAEIVGADIASLYLREGQDGEELVLRGNVGFPMGARGTVRLSVGEGITGMAVECLRPISVVQAPEHERYRAFPELDEDRYPVFLAVPIVGHKGALGALVLQRAGDRAFDTADIELCVALTAPITSGIRHAQLAADAREGRDPQSRRTGGGTRKVTLPGIPVTRGRALGAIAAMRRPASLPQAKGSPEDVKLLNGAFDVAGKALGELVTRAAMLELSREAQFLSTYLLMVTDARLRSRAKELIKKERKSIAQALGQCAREAARAANGLMGDPFLQERARDIEDLCDALVMLAAPDARAELPSRAVLLGDQLTVFDLLVSARAQPVGIALTERANGPRTGVLLSLMAVPSIVDVAGAFRWAAPGDVALLDADHGFLVINPSRAEVASLRAERRRTSEAAEEAAAGPPGDEREGWDEEAHSLDADTLPRPSRFASAIDVDQNEARGVDEA